VNLRRKFPFLSTPRLMVIARWVSEFHQCQ
jgi:hypothetical protein